MDGVGRELLTTDSERLIVPRRSQLLNVSRSIPTTSPNSASAAHESDRGYF
jgi:hypothetical protein